ncbi:MAG TPA: threonine aldolase family protein [Acidimicrobiales bacterium]|nr:threonine aldolase family protein [Acidimicrobiales bacterium]
MLVDLRSDTVTRPTPEMRRAMAEAEVGDDEYGEDPTVNHLQETFAELVGKPAALFVPSGTMSNQIALQVLTRPGDAVVVGAHQHVVLYEEGAAAVNAGISWAPADDSGGSIGPSDVEAAVERSRHHQPGIGAVAVEDTHMASGGTVWDLDRLEAVASAARRHGLPVHLDGARLWHASVASGEKLSDRAAPATLVTCCLSKALSAPVGSVLAGPEELIDEARLRRKRLGGTMRQAGVLAAAGLVAIGSGIDRLAEDHERATRLAVAVAERWPDAGCDPRRVQTNIVLFSHPDPAALVEYLRDKQVLAGTIAPGTVRLVTHRDVGDDGIDLACKAIAGAPAS